VCVCVCVCERERESMLASQVLSNFAEPCSYPSSTPKACTRAHTHMQSIPQEPRREWQAGAGGGETSQEANRCSPSGFSQVAYIKKKRGKKAEKDENIPEDGQDEHTFF